MKAVIIIPTYNEAGNIGKLIDILEVLFKEKIPSKWNMHILVVDDTSPDGTSDIVRDYMKKYKNVDLFLNKEKVGLGGAYMKGMRYAIDTLKADVMFEMDADFQHDETLIPKFLEKIDGGADVVIGARYMKGGSIPHYWGFNRKLLSVGGNIYIRLLMFMLDRKIHDWTTGFRAIKPWVYEKVKDKITELKTYSFQISFLYFARKEGAVVAEVPLNFRERKEGKSKMPGLEGTIKTFWFVTKVRAFDFLRSKFLKFAAVGFAGFIVNLVLLRVFRALGLPEVLAWALSTEGAILNNFTFNNIWTFKESRIAGLGKIISKFLQFNLSSGGAIIIQSIFGPIGVGIVGAKYDFIVLFFVVAFLVLPYNYFMYNVFIWKTWKIPGLGWLQKLVG